MRILDKYGGKIVNVRTDLVQNATKERNNTTTGKEIEVERVNEIIGGLKWR